MRHIHYFFILANFTLFTFLGCNLLGGDDNATIPGKIVFAGKDENGDSQIFTMNANGGNVKQLTYFPPDGEAYSPSWSPDGQQIIFTSFKGGISTGPAIWVMDADGSNQRFLYHPDPDNEHAFPVIGHNPRWSPDGTKVAFDLCLNCQIYNDNTIWIFDTLSKELTQLTSHEDNPGHPASDLYPIWSPDGTQIAFSSDRDYRNKEEMRYLTDLYLINVDGTGIQRVTENGHAGLPTWNANGHDIDFVTFKSTNPVAGIYQLNLANDDISIVIEDVSENIWLHPYSWSLNNNQLLAGTFEYDQFTSRSSVSKLLILNTQTGTLKELISKTSRNSNPAINSADWVDTEK